VFGYLPEIDVPQMADPMDFAAWMEVYLDGRWWTFDPRNNATRKGRVLIGRGRDAVDVVMVTTSVVRCCGAWRSGPRRRLDAGSDALLRPVRPPSSQELPAAT
jgi:hypothetical protein